MATLEEIRARYNAGTARIIELSGIVDRRYISPFQTSPAHDGSPHVEKNGDVYSFVVTERGSEYERKTTTDPDELLYWLVSGAVFAAALWWPARHGRSNEDFRRVLFEKEIEWLSELSPVWAARKRSEINCILQSHPFSDGLAPESL
jgi:hypothetical protein